ncbi:hypothetical protein [Roseospira navarrensis]|uniref:Uncharacterized protein n=1 Tax=Roseospira navarrensis TaxID=140058 RepID=A0A7X1ZG45_9PROT|nr:hypothetical protein [Roseospira navarrensis]MQX37901.1 hypothetical protein [Roseospira navarrensis]
MSTVPPPLPPTVGGTPMPAPAPAMVIVTRPPPAVAALPPDAVVQATVTQGARPGQPVLLDTPLGPLEVRAGQALPRGASLTLVLNTTGPEQAQFRLTSLNGRAIGPGAAALSTASGQTAAAAAGSSASAALGTPRLPGAMTATVLTQSGANAGGGATAAPPGPPGAMLPVGTRLTVQLVSVQAPGGTGGAAPGAGPASGAGQAAPAATVPAGTGTGTGGRAAPPGAGSSAPAPSAVGDLSGRPDGSAGSRPLSALSSLVARVTGQAPPGAGGPAPMAGPLAGSTGATAASGGTAPQTLTGTLMTAPSGGRTLLGTQAGTLALPVRLDAPPGSQVTLSVLSTLPPAPTGPAAAGAALPQGGTTGWPALTESLDTLNRADPAAARALEAAIPRPGPQLAFAMVSVAGALRAGGDIRQWPGEGVTRALDRVGGRGEQLAQTLRRDLADLAGRARETPGGEWRAITLPFADQAEISAISLILRVPGGGRGDRDGAGQDGDDERAGGGEPGQRFLVDVTLSELGRIQIDGLMQAKARRLQIILRTGRPLPEEMCRDLQVIADTSLAAFGLDGALSIRADEPFLDPLPAGDGPPPTPPGGLVA